MSFPGEWERGEEINLQIMNSCGSTRAAQHLLRKSNSCDRQTDKDTVINNSTFTSDKPVSPAMTHKVNNVQGHNVSHRLMAGVAN